MSTMPSASIGRILFADDDAFFRDLAQDALMEAGFDTTIVSGGAATIAALADDTYDLLILDLAMPEVSGFDVLQHARSTPALAELPIIVITGNDDADSVSRSFDLGATSFLAKPLNWVLFVHHVNFVLKSARMQSDLRHASRTAEFMSGLKSRLVDTLVTEFQTPLKSASGFSRLLREEVDGPIASPLYKAWIGDLQRSLERLTATHAKMLNFGSSLAEGIELNEHAIAIAPWIAETVDHVTLAAQRRHVRVAVTSAVGSGCELRCDSVLLSEAMRNVLDHAVRFSRRGSEIVVGVARTPAAELRISVTDTSATSGLLSADVKPIAKTSMAGRAAQFELSSGLNVSRLLVEAHKGRFTRTPLEDQGVVWEIFMPADRVMAPLDTKIQPAALITATARLQPKKASAGGFLRPVRPATHRA